MPPDVLQEIARRIVGVPQSRDMYGYLTFIGLHVLSGISKTLRDTIKNDTELRYHERRRAFLPVEQVHRLVGMVSGMAHLNSVQRERLITTALSMESELDKMDVLPCLEPVAAHLSDSDRDRVAAGLIGITNEKDKSTTISGWGSGLAHLNESQRGQLVASATRIRNEVDRARALAGLATEMPDLGEAHRDQLIAAATSLRDETLRACTLATLVCAQIRL